MARSRLPGPALMTGRPVLLLSVEWAGSVFRFATEQVSIDSTDGELHYTGGLVVDTIAEQIDRETISADALSVPVEVWFPIDVVERTRAGLPLSMATAEIAVIAVAGYRDNSTPAISFEDRSVIMTGSVVEPVIGVPTESPRRAAFSIESAPFDDGSPVLDPRSRIDNATDKQADGKMPPLVFGRPGVYTTPTGSIRYTAGSPAYEYTGNVGQPTNTRKAIVTVGRSTSTTVRIETAGVASPYTESLTVTTTAAGLYHTEIQETSISDNYFDELPIWIIWNGTRTGGVVNPYSGDTLSGLGDLIRYLLSRASTRADHGAWAAAAGYLNRYRMAGYINEAKTTVWGFIADHILPIIPGLAVLRGPSGLVPVLFNTGRPPGELLPLTTGPGFMLISGETATATPADIVNDLLFEYAFDAQNEVAKRAIRVGPAGVDGVDIVSQSATVSDRIYGRRPAVLSSRYVYSDDTARRCAVDYIKDRAFISTEIEIEAAIEYGWIDLGDEFALTCAELQLSAARVVVVGRGWRVAAGVWLLTLRIDPVPR